jgi:hypothetical protein
MREAFCEVSENNCVGLKTHNRLFGYLVRLHGWARLRIRNKGAEWQQSKGLTGASPTYPMRNFPEPIAL